MAGSTVNVSFEYERPKLYFKQERALFNNSRYKIIEAATKTGKTHGAIVWIQEETLKLKPGQNTWWVAPVYNQAKIAYLRLKRVLQPLLKAKYVKVNDVSLTIEYVGYGTIYFKSADNPDSLYGEDVYACVFDEFNRARESAWIAIRSTLTSTQGKVVLIGNVLASDNWGYKLARKAEQGLKNWSFTRLTAYDAVEAGIFPLEEVEDAKSVLPEEAFQQLYLAVASENALNPFGIKAIDNCIRPLSTDPPVCFGIDVARKKDFTVIIGLDENNFVCVYEKFQENWDITRDLIIRTVQNRPVKIDATGTGDALAEQLVSAGLDVEPVVFSLQRKQALIENLAYFIQRQLVGFPEGSISDQLKAMIMDYSKNNRNIKYTSMSENDDEVMALALATEFLIQETDYTSLLAETLKCYGSSAEIDDEEFIQNNLAFIFE